jgi:alkylation response protein AidB-like acyl-CoA dehydrogenase
MPVWLAGTETQRADIARSVLDGQRVALGLTERGHGADLVASEMSGYRTDSGYVVNGTKWLINNVRLARYLCLLVREHEGRGLRSLTLLLVDLHQLPASSYELLPRIATHGIRGADIAGIRFHDAPVPASACVGAPGRGLELTARSLMVTRTLVPGLSLGALDTALRCTLDFLRERRLYGGLATDIPYVRDELAAAYLDLTVAGVVARSCVRVLHALPQLAPISSAVAKYLVPHVVEARMRKLATVLGARWFLREDHWFGIFEKLVRDARLFGLFDGSEPVVLTALAAQLQCLAETGTDPHAADEIFIRDDVSTSDFSRLADMEMVADDDPVTAGAEDVCLALEMRPDLAGPAALLRHDNQTLRARAEHSVVSRSEDGQRLADRYARLFAAVCLARSWPDAPAPLLGAGITSLLRPGTRMPPATSEALFHEMEQWDRQEVPC